MHEIIHLVLGKGSHRAAGLMRPDWPERLLQDASEWWGISVEQRRQLVEAARQHETAGVIWSDD